MISTTEVLVVLDTAARTSISLVFAISLFLKLSSATSRTEFRSAVAQLAPALPAAPAVIGVVAIEVLVPISLFTSRQLGYGLASLLLVTYAVAIARLVRTGRRVSCGCLGSTSAPVGPRQIARNVVLVGICGVGAGASAIHGGASSALGISLGGVFGLVVALSVIVADRYTDMFDKPLEGT